MVTIWPMTAIQRSWMSCCMFSRPLGSSKGAELALHSVVPARVATGWSLTERPARESPAGATERPARESPPGTTGRLAALFTYHHPQASGNHERKGIPGDGIDQVAVVERNDGKATDGRGRLRAVSRRSNGGVGINKVWGLSHIHFCR